MSDVVAVVAPQALVELPLAFAQNLVAYALVYPLLGLQVRGGARATRPADD